MIKLLVGAIALTIIILALLGLVDVQALLHDAINAVRDILKTLLGEVLA